MIIQIISAFSAVFMFTMLLEIPRKYVVYASASGAIGWWVYLIVQGKEDSSMLAAFLSTLVVAFLSHILARIKKAPVTVFLVSGTLPAVPGAAIYRSVYFLLHDEQVLAIHYLNETILIAGGIALAISIMDSLFRLLVIYDRRNLKAGS